MKSLQNQFRAPIKESTVEEHKLKRHVRGASKRCKQNVHGIQLSGASGGASEQSMCVIIMKSRKKETEEKKSKKVL